MEQEKANAKIQLKSIQEIIVLIDKLSTLIFDDETNCNESLTAVIENRHSDIKTPVTLNLLKDSNGNDIPLNQLDKLILTAAISEQAAGNDVVTFGRLFHTIGGKRLDKAKNIQAAIDDSISKLRRTEIIADVTALTNKYKRYAATLDAAPNVEGKIILKGALLPSETITANINGKVTDGAIHFSVKPVLFKIAEMKNQLVHCSPKLLAAPIRTTEQTLKLKNYLLERVLKIKGSHDRKSNKRVRKLNKSILFDTICRQCELNTADKWQMQDLRKCVAQNLDHFKEQGLIKSYEFTKKSRKFYSIEIEI